MDVRELVDRLTEPAATGRLRALLAGTAAAMTGWQRDETAARGLPVPFDLGVLGGLRRESDQAAGVRRHAHALAARRSGPAAPVDEDRLGGVPLLLEHAADRPSVVSAVLWSWLGAGDPELASYLVQVVRERAGLPGLRRRLEAADGQLASAGGNLPALVDRFADRQLADACAWIAELPAPLEGGSLAEQVAAIEAARAAAPRLPAGELTGFLRRAATFLVQLSAAEVDPLGFPLAREVAIESDPPVERRVAIARWARRSGLRVCPRGTMQLVGIQVDAPWPLRLELVAAEPGHGLSGSVGLLLRLASGELAPAAAGPMLLLFAGEPPEERGQRFERWLADAWPRAIEPWRAWS